MTEKLASTEIAQSRERSKSEILFTRYTGPEIDPVAYDFDDSQREKIFAFTDWCMEAAERDTRERIAQQLTDFVMEAAKLESGKWPITVSDILELAERIRGKV